MVLVRSFAALRQASQPAHALQWRRFEHRTTPTPAAASRPARLLAKIVAVSAVLLLTVALRLQGIPGGGPVAYDEGWALDNGRHLLLLLTHPGTWSPVLHKQIHLFPFGNDGKVGHDLLLGSVSTAGVSPESLTWYSSLAGVVAVAVLALLAWRRWGAPAAMVAGAFAGSVPLSIVFSHRIVAEADGLAAVALVLYLFQRWWDRRPSRRLFIITVVALLATLTLSYRFVPTLLPILAVFAWLAWWYRGHDTPPTASIGRLVGVCLVPTLAILAIYLLAAVGTAIGIRAAPGGLQNWLLRSPSGAPLPFASPDFYARTLWDFAGPAFIAATGLALVALASRWKRLDPLAGMAMGSLVGTLLVFSAVHDKAPRALVIAIPFGALVVAKAVTLWRNEAGQWLVALTLSGLFLLSGWSGSSAARELSGTAAAGRWLMAHPGPIVASRSVIFVPYTERTESVTGFDPAHQVVDFTPSSTIESLRLQGARWVVVDAHGLLKGQSPVFKDLIACGVPAAEFNDSADWMTLTFLEEADTLHLDYGPVLSLRQQILAASHGRQIIRIYDLTGPGTAACA